MKLIVGLGNPGKKYAKTRHNVGFLVIQQLKEKLAESHAVSDWQLSKKFNAEVCGTTRKGEKLVLAKPMTFMNASGQAVQLIASFYKLAARDIIVVHDDKDLTLGAVKVQQDRGHAGHNGVRSIAECTGTLAFTRVRVGIAAENEKKMADVSKFVLSNFSLGEKRTVREMIVSAVDEIMKLI